MSEAISRPSCKHPFVYVNGDHNGIQNDGAGYCSGCDNKLPYKGGAKTPGILTGILIGGIRLAPSGISDSAKDGSTKLYRFEKIFKG